jgi:hypothetical protein
MTRMNITDENTFTINSNSIHTNMTNCHCRSRSPIRPESRRREMNQHCNCEKNVSNNNNKNPATTELELALALELTPEPEDEEEHYEQMVQSCVSFGGPVVSDDEDDNEDEVECSLMDMSMDVDVDVETTRKHVILECDVNDDDSDDDDVDMQVEEQDNHDICNVIDLISLTTETTTGESLSLPLADTHTPLKSHRTVSFGSIYTREYSLTVGDHPCSTDSVGITLDWGHAAEYAVPVEQQDWTQMPLTFGEQGQQFSPNNNNNNSPRRRIRRLSASERRKRVCSVTGCLPSDVRAAEYNCALQRYQQELNEVMEKRNRLAAEENETQAHSQEDADNDSRRLLQHQQHLEVLYSCFQDVQYRQEQDYNNYVQRHRQQGSQQQRQHVRRQLRRSKRAAPEPAHAAVL